MYLSQPNPATRHTDEGGHTSEAWGPFYVLCHQDSQPIRSGQFPNFTPGMFLCSFWAAHPCFHFLCTEGFHLSLVMSSSTLASCHARLTFCRSGWAFLMFGEVILEDPAAFPGSFPHEGSLHCSLTELLNMPKSWCQNSDSAARIPHFSQIRQAMIPAAKAAINHLQPVLPST